jgi:HTH-type transcriptional regulator, transcriptional repressor of NAD biosynthesis genes
VSTIAGYKKGLVVGKFLPVHNGHISLIRFAASQCNELVVSMSYTSEDPIDPQLRFSWIREIFADEGHIKCFMVLDDFDDISLPLFERTKIWADFIRKTYPSVDAIFSSEDYGEPFAHHLGVKHVLFDQQRVQIPISATLIRQQPLKYWDYIPEIVRPHFVKRICFYGPESTGKSTMAQHLAQVYQTQFVPEVARELITSNDFSVDDIIKIGHAQTERVLEKTKVANRFLFCDTDLITTQIYSKHYLHVIPDVLYELESMIHYDHYFLFDIDIPWVADNLRDLQDRRSEMFETFRSELLKRKIPYTLVQGTFEERESIINSQLQKLL